MMAVPFFGGKLESRKCLKVTCSSVPSVEEVSGPTLGRNQHGILSLAVSIAFELRVTQTGVQEVPRSEVVEIRDTHGDTFAVLIRRRGLRDQRVDIGKLRSLGERVDVYTQQVLRRQDRL